MPRSDGCRDTGRGDVARTTLTDDAGRTLAESEFDAIGVLPAVDTAADGRVAAKTGRAGGAVTLRKRLGRVAGWPWWVDALIVFRGAGTDIVGDAAATVALAALRLLPVTDAGATAIAVATAPLPDVQAAVGIEWRFLAFLLLLARGDVRGTIGFQRQKRGGQPCGAVTKPPPGPGSER